jgi:O-antigen ligase
LVAALAIGQLVTGAIVRAGNVGRVAGVYYSPTHLALYLERVWPPALAVALWGGLRRRWRRAAWACVALLTVGLYLTFSRAAWLLAVPVALLVLGMACGRRLRWWAVLVLALVVLAAGAGVLAGRGTSPAGLLDEVRVPLWQSTLEMAGDHPWLGVGLDGFRFVYPQYMRPEAWTEPLLYHPHNAWLDAAVRMGLPGLVLFVMLVGACVVSALSAIRRWRSRAEDARTVLLCAVAVGCLAGLAAGLAHGLVDSGYFLVDLSWCLALAAGLTEGMRNRVSENPVSRPDLDACDIMVW